CKIAADSVRYCRASALLARGRGTSRGPTVHGRFRVAVVRKIEQAGGGTARDRFGGRPQGGRGVRVLIIRNHALIGQSLVAMLRNLPPDEALEAQLCDSDSAIERARTSSPEVVLIEAIAEFGNGVATVRGLAEATPGVRLVVLGAGEDEASIYEAV